MDLPSDFFVGWIDGLTAAARGNWGGRVVCFDT